MSLLHEKPVEAPNPGVAFDGAWINSVKVDTALVEHAAESITSRAGVTNEAQADLLQHDFGHGSNDTRR